MQAYKYKELLEQARQIASGRWGELTHMLARLIYNTHYGKRVIANSGASLTLTLATHEGKTIYLTGTGAPFTITLPPADADAVGAKFDFFVGQVNTSNFLIKSVRGADVMKGIILGRSATDSATDAPRTWEAGATDDTITLNGTTTGGAVIGDVLSLFCPVVNVWSVQGLVSQSGTEATPFSDTVA